MKNILITGGGFHNKGAQAMTFIAISEMAQRFPEHRLIVVADKDAALMKRPDYPYNFAIMKTDMCIPNGYYLLGGMAALYAISHRIRMKNLKASKKIWQDTEYVIDVSGYALGSNWDQMTCMRTILWAGLAHKFHAKMIYMPQSFGPFDFRGRSGKIIDHFIRQFMKKADLICAREKTGLELLQRKYHLDNVMQVPDMVLQNKKICLDAIYKEIPQMPDLNIQPGSVGIIPNTETIRYLDKAVVLAMYQEIIRELLQQKYKVYVLAHAKNDNAFVSEIKNLYADNEDVVEIKNDLTCLEFDRNVIKFDFMIASRYHSVVHSYRNSIPCIVIGWAEKYQELAQMCGQEEFVFDVRKGIDPSSIVQAVKVMTGKVREYSNIIKNHVTKIQSENIFDQLEQI